MKKNSEYVGVDEKFIPEDEKYVKDSVLGNREESKNKIKKGLIIGLGVYAIWVLLAIVFLVVVVVLIFNHARKTNEQIFGLFGNVVGNVVEQVNGETQSTENSENQMEGMQNAVNSMSNMMDQFMNDEQSTEDTENQMEEMQNVVNSMRNMMD